MNIRIFGKEDCQRCEFAKRLIPEAEYRHHSELYDLYDPDTATGIVTASGGELPIILICEKNNYLAFRPTIDSGALGCVDGICAIPATKQFSHGPGKGKK